MQVPRWSLCCAGMQSTLLQLQADAKPLAQLVCQLVGGQARLPAVDFASQPQDQPSPQQAALMEHSTSQPLASLLSAAQRILSSKAGDRDTKTGRIMTQLLKAHRAAAKGGDAEAPQPGASRKRQKLSNGAATSPQVQPSAAGPAEEPPAAGGASEDLRALINKLTTCT